MRRLLSKLSLLTFVGISSAVLAAEVEIKLLAPTQLIPGGKREIITKLPPKVRLESVEVTPPEGVVVSEIRQLDEEKTGNDLRWRMTFAVEPNTPPGERSIVLFTSQGRSAPVTVTIPPHVPKPSKVEVLEVKLSPLKVKLAVLVHDVKDDLGESPRIMSYLTCGGSVLVEMGYASQVTKVGDHQYHVEFEIGRNPNTRATGEAACKLKVAVRDETKYEGELETAILLKEGN